MANKKNKQMRPMRPKKAGKAKAVRSSNASLAQYAALLNDPCNAELVHPPYMGTGTGFLQRFETNMSFNSGSYTSGRVVLAPSCISGGSDNGTEWIGSVGYFQATSSGTAGYAALYGAGELGNQPGYNFLQTNSAQVRPVAACLQLRYLGKELDRSGQVGVGVLNAERMVGALTPAACVTMAAQVSRMPDDMVEVKWTPNQRDQEFRNIEPYAGAANSGSATTVWERAYGDCNSIYAAWTDVNPGSLISVRFVVVYEWQPFLDNSGFAPSVPRPLRQKYTVNDALLLLEKTGNWMFSFSTNAARAAASVYAGGSAIRRLATGVARLAIA